MAKHVRNVVIIVALAAAVAFLPGGGRTAGFVTSVLSTAIGVTFVLLAARFYRENRMTIYGLGDRHRALLYGGMGALLLALAGTERLLVSGPGVVVWLLLVGGAVAAFFAVWQHHRSYG